MQNKEHAPGRLFAYGESELDFLRRCDPKMAQLIDRFGMIRREVEADLFVSLIRSIVGQQISGRAAETVWKRLMACVGEALTAASLLGVDPQQLRACGLSMRKVGYVCEAARRVQSGALRLQQLPQMEDQEVVHQLTDLPGVGVWTAQMLMIFSMQRPNVLCYEDLIIRRALCHLYGREKLSRQEFAHYHRLFTPYATVASFYLWAYGNALDRRSEKESEP